MLTNFLIGVIQYFFLRFHSKESTHLMCDHVSNIIEICIAPKKDIYGKRKKNTDFIIYYVACALFFWRGKKE